MTWKPDIRPYSATPSATAAEWYSSVASALLANGARPTDEDVSAAMGPLLDYVTAELISQWCSYADIEMSRELEVLVGSHLDDPVKAAALPAGDGADRNGEDRVFDEGMLLSDFVSEKALRAICDVQLTDEELVSAGERGAGSKPVLLVGAFEAIGTKMMSELWFVFDAILPQSYSAWYDGY